MISVPAKNVEAIWVDYHEKLLGFIQKRVKDKCIAEDILQDVFIKILNKIDTLREDSKIQNWLYQLTRNTIIDFYRANKIMEDIPESLIEEDSTNTDSAVEEMKSCIMPVIDSLDEKYREAVTLTEMEGLSQKELASKLNISYTGAKSRVQRGRAAVKDTFSKYCTFKYDSCGNVVGYDDSCGKC
jgi:RNA polymerase sigma-70 factor (ECF subfamily)